MDKKNVIGKIEGLTQEFKAFALKGNVVDLAVAVVVGGAFGKIVSSLVADIVMPMLSGLMAGGEFTDLTLKLGESGAVLRYGAFAQTVVDFFIIALAVFFAIKCMTRLNLRAVPAKAAVPEDILLLREIRDLMQTQSDEKKDSAH